MVRNRAEVNKLLTILGSSIAVAFIVIVAFVYYFGSSGTVLLRSVLVSPKALGKNATLEFIHADPSGKGWAKYEVSVAQYKEFYRDVRGLRSLPQLSDEYTQQFETVTPSTLTLLAPPQKKGATLLFQQVDFLSEGDLFRVQLRNEQEQWAYFRRPGIFETVLQAFGVTNE